jgi:hypothetical protein
MEDILKVLVDSRQQGGTSSQAGADPMASLIGNLLGAATQSTSQTNAPVNPNSGGADLGSMMGLLETVIGGQTSSNAANDPVMALLSPFVPPLAKKANIPPEIAMVVISFVVHKLLAHHPRSGRDSNSFNFDDMLNQMSAGKVDSNLLHQSGMVAELSKKTGLDEAATEQALQLAFSAVGKTVSSMAGKGSSAKPSSVGTKAKTGGGKSLGASGAKRGNKIER